MAIDPEKERRILDAAEELFARHGFKKTSIDEIAQRAQVGKGTVYLVSDSKEDLFYQVVHREIRAWVAEVSHLIDPRCPADQLLARCSVAAYQYLEDRPLVRDLLLGNYEEMLPMWLEELGGLRTIARGHIVEILQLGVQQGLIRGDLAIDKVARILQEMQTLGLLLGYREKRPLAEQLELGGICLDMLLRGLLKR